MKELQWHTTQRENIAGMLRIHRTLSLEYLKKYINNI